MAKKQNKNILKVILVIKSNLDLSNQIYQIFYSPIEG